MPNVSTPSSQPSSSDRASNREVEYEDQRETAEDGRPPRPATEPRGAADSSQSPKTQTDPGTGELAPGRLPNARNDPDADEDEPRTEGAAR